jgi:hypothetical protein
MGITCQRVFSEAFKSGGYDEAISRALFARFSLLSAAHKEENIPLIVSDFCTRALQAATRIAGSDLSEKCFGCCLTVEGLEELVFSTYSMVTPEIDDNSLHQFVTDPSTLIAKTKFNSELTEQERILSEILDECDLEDDTGKWMDMLE